MEKSKASVAEEDRISGLPDGILHCILRRLQSQEQAAQTIALSRRWKSIWRSYPIVDYDYQIRNRHDDLQKFGAASIQRFSILDSLFRMEILKLDVGSLFDDSSLLVVEQLFDLASKRKAEEVAIKLMRKFCCSVGSISGSAVKILRLERIQFKDWNDDQLPLSLKHLQTLCLNYVELDGFYTSLIDCSPRLETLELGDIISNDKLRISNDMNLKNIKIWYCNSLKELDITAPALQTLCLLTKVKKFELTAPRLHHLEIMKVRDIRVDVLISKLRFLKSLALGGFSKFVEKLKFWSPNLETFMLFGPNGLREIDLDCGPHLKTFDLACSGEFPNELQECRINNSPACRWLIYNLISSTDEHTSQWFVKLRSFIGKFTRLGTVYLYSIKNFSSEDIRFNEEEVNHHGEVRPVSITRLTIFTDIILSDAGHKALLDGLFWACRPQLFDLQQVDQSSEGEDAVVGKWVQMFLSQVTENGGGTKWQRQLKHVKIGTEATQGFVDISEDVVGRLEDIKLVRFMLTWQ